MPSLNKLRWRCRRGTLELDLILQTYLENNYPLAPVNEQQAFVRLLELEDTALADYLLGNVLPAAELIRHYAKAK
jgi:antitoxin CptB